MLRSLTMTTNSTTTRQVNILPCLSNLLRAFQKKEDFCTTCTGGPPLTQKSLTRFPLPWFLAYVRVSGGFSCYVVGDLLQSH